ncbi:MAG: DNA recombination protein RmuC [Opitutae bacterium]|nr:DNA recombination protein RmuC [Opitutae bacterium]
MDNLVYGLAGMAIGIGFLLVFIVRQRSQQGGVDSLSTENRLLKEEIKRGGVLEKELRESLRQAEIDRAEMTTLNEELNKRLEHQLEEQESLAKQMQERFENLANKILEQKSAKFTETNKENLKNVLEPLDKDIRAFRKKVEDIHEKDLSQQASLKEFLGNLQLAQTQLSEEARNLTTALKGDSKKQGDWGEFILERTLEASGLVKGQEFLMQETFDRQRPDAVIRLPEDRAIVVDSKVSLTAYERSISLEDEELRNQALKEHLQSLKKHVDELSDKDYSAIEQINAPDFVLLFVPVEPAFGAALREDPNLYQYAFDRKIVLVTSTTLMATIKTVANLWKLEKQNKHAHEIARQAGNLYDKFIGFLGNIEDIGKALQKATDAHEKGVGQLSSGSGNLISRVEKLRALGIRAKKELPASFASKLESEDTHDQEILSFAEEDKNLEDEGDELNSS